MKRLFKLIAFLQIILFLLPLKLHAADYFINDSFNDTTKVDIAGTTAEIDTTNGWVALGLKNLANSLILYEDNFDITLINNDAVETYQFNGTKMELDFRRSINGTLTEPISISGRTGEYIVLDRGAKEASWYHYDGTGMVKNGSLSISALTDPRALDIMTGAYDFALLDEDRLKWYSYDGVGLAQVLPLSFNMTDRNPISVSAEDDNYGTVILDKANKEVLYYSFNGTTMVRDAAKSIEAAGEFTKPISLSVSKDEGLYLIVDDNQVKTYNYDGSIMVYNPQLSVAGLNKPLAVALKPGLYDYAVLSHDIGNNPQVSYYAFNGINMEEVPELKITSLNDIHYANDQILQGKAVDAAYDVSGLKLTADIELPAGTSIFWEVTVDGAIWKPATLGNTVKFATPGTKPNYRAILHTDDNTVTPKILSVQLVDVSLSVGSFQIIDIVGPAIPGNPALPTEQQVSIWAGYNVSFQIETTGAAESVVADIYVDGEVITLNSLTGELVPSEPATSFTNTWRGTFHTDAMAATGTLLDIYFTVRKGTDFVCASYPEFALIYGSALGLHEIHLTH